MKSEKVIISLDRNIDPGRTVIKIDFSNYKIPKEMIHNDFSKRKIKKFKINGENFYVTASDAFMIYAYRIYLPVKCKKTSFTVENYMVSKYLKLILYILKNLKSAKSLDWYESRNTEFRIKSIIRELEK